LLPKSKSHNLYRYAVAEEKLSAEREAARAALEQQCAKLAAAEAAAAAAANDEEALAEQMQRTEEQGQQALIELAEVGLCRLNQVDP
jgi:hypothetical protein